MLYQGAQSSSLWVIIPALKTPLLPTIVHVVSRITFKEYATSHGHESTGWEDEKSVHDGTAALQKG